MAVQLGDTLIGGGKIWLGSTAVQRVYLGSTQVWPSFTPVGQTFTTVGAYTYNIPAGCTAIDVILLGGGGGGKGFGFAGAWADGGKPGEWYLATLVRGVDIPLTTTQITGVVGAGGTGGAGASGGNGGNGGASTATATGMTARSGPGGLGATTRTLAIQGPGPGDRSLNGQNYIGGALSPTGAGNPPGGAGCGTTISFTAGSAGGRGQVWFYAY
ncbi:hypothetical protein SEA_RAHALELUJAH_31 [Mycobacterium phage Rahalelujah]|nr:hypothetical protein SEA_RAHALELUJAH_31 [Mycobacterium phage Rahalelujah]